MKKLLLLFTAAGFAFSAAAQIIKDPTEWTFSAKGKGKGHYTVLIHASIKSPWHMYALKPGGDGSLIPTSIKINDATTGVTMNGAVKEVTKPRVETIEGVDGKVALYSGKADFAQEVTGHKGSVITGTVEYQTCSNTTCLPPKKKTFSITLP